MKFVVITDLHQKASMIPRLNRIIGEEGPDAVLFLGDVTDMGTWEDAQRLVSSIESKVYVVPGNCDPLDMPAHMDEVGVDMHGKSAEIGGIHVAGLGGSNITIFGTPFELKEDEIDRLLRPVCREGMLLMTHAPAYGTFDHIPNGTSVGSPAIKKIVEDFHPVAALSGHIHEDVGIKEENGTLFMNPGPAREGRCGILEIDGGRATGRLIGPGSQRI